MQNQNQFDQPDQRDQRAAEQQQLQAAKAITEEKVKLCLRLEALELEEHQLSKRASKGDLLPLTFPAGVFVPSAQIQEGVPRSIFRDDFLKMVALVHPEMIPALLPADQAAAVFQGIDTDYKRNTLFVAGHAVWHIQPMYGLRGPRLARSPIRLRERGLSVL